MFKTLLVFLLILSYVLIKGQERSKSFLFNQISKDVFEEGFIDNYNAIPIQLIDSKRIEKALQIIDKTYSQHERDFAESELCKSVRCLVSFQGYYKTLGVLAFFIRDYHYNNVVFIKEDADYLVKRLDRFNGSFGVMSKGGFWVGLDRFDCDNYLQIEICEITKNGASSIIRFDFKTIDINESIEEPIFWANKNTIYIAVIEFSNIENSGQPKYYEIKFDH